MNFLDFIDDFLDYIKIHGTIQAQIENINMYYKGTVEDTVKGKREIFYIERKIK